MSTLKLTIVALALFGVFVGTAVQAARPSPSQGSATQAKAPEGTQVAYMCTTTCYYNTCYTNCF